MVPPWLKGLWRDYPRIVVPAITVLALACIVALIWPITDVIAAHDVGVITGTPRAAALRTAREAVRTQLLTLGAGLFAAGALWFTGRNFVLSRGALEQTRRTVELTEQGQVTDRYTRAIEQLGSDKVDVRIGAIYALERIARDSARDHPTVMEVLSAFIREHSPERVPDPAAVETAKLKTRADVEAAMTVIARRDEARDVGRINLAGADLTRTDLTRAKLAGAKLVSTNFTGADLTGADLTGARLINATLANTVLTGATLASAELQYAKLPNAHLLEAVLTDAKLFTTILTGAHLVDTDFTGAKLPNTSFDGARLDKAKFIGAELIRAKFVNAKLARADFTGATITTADFTGADVRGVTFTGANLLNTKWPEDAPVPEGWVRDAQSGRLKPAAPTS
jgi:uncharacterized protein YjbI with pentapeptide repeats